MDTEMEIELCTDRCRRCAYGFEENGSGDTRPFCGYILFTKTSRPCPAGKNCTVFKRRGRGPRKTHEFL